MVSVIIPTYNRAGRIEGAIRSVLEQTYRDLELIVVDDGSTDRTALLCEEIADSRLRYLRIEHAGVSAARNEGIELARRPWLAFLDSDDSWMADKLERQMTALEAEPLYQVAYTNEVWIRNGRRVNQGKRHRKYGGWIYHRCLPLCIISPSSVLLHQSVLESTGAFDPAFPVCEDYDLWLRVTASRPVLFLDEPLITKVGGHADQLSKSRWGFDIFRVRALLKALESGRLTPQQRIWTAQEMVSKAEILHSGFAKRDKGKEAAYYRGLIARWK